MERGREKAFQAAVRRLSDDASPAAKRRLAELRQLPTLRVELGALRLETATKKTAERRSSETRRRDLEQRISDVERREDVRGPARTTISNKLQLITRALKLAAESMEGVPDLSGVPMPSASPGRDRRVAQDELDRLVARGRDFNPLLPCIARFAVATALRRERILEFSEAHVVELGSGKQAIKFPRDEDARRKRTGVIPLSREIRSIIEEAKAMRNSTGRTDPIFDLNPVTFDHHWRRLVLDVGLDGLHFHDLRHEATSRLFERGLSLAEVMSITGHSTNDMVDRYSHYSAALVLDKLDSEDDPKRLASEIKFLLEQLSSMVGGREEAKRIVLQL